MKENINGNAGKQGYCGHRISVKKPSEARIKKLIEKKRNK